MAMPIWKQKTNAKRCDIPHRVTTKAITTAGIMILYDQAKLLLDEPISNYIPAFKNPVVLD